MLPVATFMHKEKCFPIINCNLLNITKRANVYKLLEFGLNHDVVHRWLGTGKADQCWTKHRRQVVHWHLICTVL